MDFVLYRAKGKNGYLYDISLDPDIDFSILKKTRNIDKFEVISEKSSLEDCKKALNKIYSKPSIISRFIFHGDYFINSALKKFNLKRVSKKINTDVEMPDSAKISKVENCITGRVVSLNKILSFDKDFNMTNDEIIKSVQALYCMRRIKIITAVKIEKGRTICSICKKEPCPECFYGFKNDDILLYAANNYGLNVPHNVSVRKSKLSSILNNAENAFNEFLSSKKNSAALWCIFNAYDYRVVAGGIADYSKCGKNILYITADSFIYEAKQKLNENIEGASIEVTDGYNPDYSQLDVSICSYNSLPSFHKAFDLVILDLRYLFLDAPSPNIYYRSQRSMKEKGKILYIVSNMEVLKNKSIINHPEVISIPLAPSLKPVPEPRIMTSRYLGNEGWYLPVIVTEMIHWSVNIKEGLMIFVPDENQMYKLYNYMVELEEFKSYQIDVSLVNDKTHLLGLKKGETDILISADLRDTLQVIENINVIVFYGDGKVFTTDTLINMSSMAVWHTGQSNGEVVFVANQENESMSLAKSAIRNINKAAWERGYLSRQKN